MATHPAHFLMAVENLRELPLCGVGSDHRTMFLCHVFCPGTCENPVPGLLSARADCRSDSVLNTRDTVGVRGMLRTVKCSSEWTDTAELPVLFVGTETLNFSHLGSMNKGSQVFS